MILKNYATDWRKIVFAVLDIKFTENSFP